MAGRLKGRIVDIRASGDLVTSFRASDLVGVPTDERVTIACDGHCTAGIFRPDHQEPAMTLLAVLDEDDMLVLTLVGENASQFLGIRSGSDVMIKWSEGTGLA